MSLPALRQLDAVPVQHDGQDMVCLYDPEGFVDTQIVLSPAALFVASCLDGKNDIADVQAAFARETGGVFLRLDDIRALVDQLDEQGFLLTERFFTLCRGVEEAFAAAKVRPAYAAGRSYPRDPEELRAFLDDLFLLPDGPGEALGEVGSGPPARGLIVPHIDFQRGGAVYGHGYLSLYRSGQPRTVFIFGVAHRGGATPFMLTRKGFDTPLGVLETDQGVMDRLEAACAWNPYEDEQVHRTEHSIEFQAVMLAYLYGPDVRIVPVLCGPFSDDPGLQDPDKVAPVAAFLTACRDAVAEADGPVTVIAGADLAHVGRHFGDDCEIDDAIVQRVRRRDEEDLVHVMQAAPGPFYRSVMKDSNQRRVCGLNCIYATLKTLDGAVASGRLLSYDWAPDPVGGMVSFAGVVLE